MKIVFPIIFFWISLNSNALECEIKSVLPEVKNLPQELCKDCNCYLDSFGELASSPEAKKKRKEQFIEDVAQIEKRYSQNLIKNILMTSSFSDIEEDISSCNISEQKEVPCDAKTSELISHKNYFSPKDKQELGIRLLGTPYDAVVNENGSEVIVPQRNCEEVEDLKNSSSSSILRLRSIAKVFDRELLMHLGSVRDLSKEDFDSLLKGEVVDSGDGNYTNLKFSNIVRFFNHTPELASFASDGPQALVKLLKDVRNDFDPEFPEIFLQEHFIDNKKFKKKQMAHLKTQCQEFNKVAKELACADLGTQSLDPSYREVFGDYLINPENDEQLDEVELEFLEGDEEGMREYISKHVAYCADKKACHLNKCEKRDKLISKAVKITNLLDYAPENKFLPEENRKSSIDVDTLCKSIKKAKAKDPENWRKVLRTDLSLYTSDYESVQGTSAKSLNQGQDVPSVVRAYLLMTDKIDVEKTKKNIELAKKSGKKVSKGLIVSATRKKYRGSGSSGGSSVVMSSSSTSSSSKFVNQFLGDRVAKSTSSSPGIKEETRSSSPAVARATSSPGRSAPIGPKVPRSRQKYEYVLPDVSKKQYASSKSTYYNPNISKAIERRHQREKRGETYSFSAPRSGNTSNATSESRGRAPAIEPVAREEMARAQIDKFESNESNGPVAGAYAFGSLASPSTGDTVVDNSVIQNVKNNYFGSRSGGDSPQKEKEELDQDGLGPARGPASSPELIGGKGAKSAGASSGPTFGADNPVSAKALESMKKEDLKGVDFDDQEIFITLGIDDKGNVLELDSLDDAGKKKLAAGEIRTIKVKVEPHFRGDEIATDESGKIIYKPVESPDLSLDEFNRILPEIYKKSIFKEFFLVLNGRMNFFGTTEKPKNENQFDSGRREIR